MAIVRDELRAYHVTINTPYLYKILSKEYINLCNVYDQMEQSPLHNDLYKFEDVYFVVDGFNGTPLRQQLTSKMEVFLAMKRQAGLEIHRGLKFNMSPITLFYSYIHIPKTFTNIKWHFGTFGVVSDRENLIKQLSSIEDKLIFRFYPEGKKTFELVKDITIAEDFGEAITKFPKSHRLVRKPLSKKILTARYGIADANHFSTLPVKDGTLCVLMVENDNPHDDHAILLLRWVPVLKSEIGNAYIHPLYKMAHIRPSDNHELFEEMVKTGNRILFGKVEGGTISILGNISALDKGPLADYVLPFSLFNLLKD